MNSCIPIMAILIPRFLVNYTPIIEACVLIEKHIQILWLVYTSRFAVSGACSHCQTLTPVYRMPLKSEKAVLLRYSPRLTASHHQTCLWNLKTSRLLHLYLIFITSPTGLTTSIPTQPIQFPVQSNTPKFIGEQLERPSCLQRRSGTLTTMPTLRHQRDYELLYVRC